MSKIIVSGMTALFVTAATMAYAQAPSAGAPETGRAAHWRALTDARIDIVKAALQLTPDQEKYWPAIEAAIRARAQRRQTRIADAEKRMTELRGDGLIEDLRNRNPIEFLQRRSDALAQRSADLKQLATAWQPLYQTLTPEQKRRMALLSIFVLREVGSAVEQRRMHEDDSDD